jgi:U3 small nucleolar RNA-associated protein 14
METPFQLPAELGSLVQDLLRPKRSKYTMGKTAKQIAEDLVDAYYETYIEDCEIMSFIDKTEDGFRIYIEVDEWDENDSDNDSDDDEDCHNEVWELYLDKRFTLAELYSWNGLFCDCDGSLCYDV